MLPHGYRKMNRIELAEIIEQLEYELKTGAYEPEDMTKMYDQLETYKQELREII